MGLLEKIKNLFTDEEEYEEDEDEIEESPKEETHQLPTFMREKIEKEEKKETKENKEEKVEIINFMDNEKIKENTNSFKFPFDFDEKDFEVKPSPLPKRVTPKVVEEKEKPKDEIKKNPNLYNGKKDKPKEVKKFKATPIISPVYGILDKNYRKEEVQQKKESPQHIHRTPKRPVDFESVRNKAYGILEDDIQNNLYNDTISEEEVNIEVINPDNVVYDALNEKKEDVTIGNAIENYYDFGVDYKNPRNDNIIEIKDEVTSNKDIKIVNHNDLEVKAEEIEVKEPMIEDSTVVEDMSHESDLELTDDLFSLIDAMYEKRNDN